MGKRNGTFFCDNMMGFMVQGETLMVDFGMPKQAMVDNILVQEPLIVHEARGCTWQAAPAQA